MRQDEAKRDYYRRRAKEEGYRSRAAFKLKQVNDKFHIMKKGSRVIDIGSAPGGWLQIASEIIGVTGILIGVDLNRVEPVRKNTIIFQEDITSEVALDKILGALRNDQADCILADLSPKISGVWEMDHYRQISLCNTVIDLLPKLLKPDGSCLMKAFQGEELESLIKRMRSAFSNVDILKPEASRKESSEVYLLGLKFIGRVPKQLSEELPSLHQSLENSDSNEYDWLDNQER